MMRQVKCEHGNPFPEHNACSVCKLADATARIAELERAGDAMDLLHDNEQLFEGARRVWHRIRETKP